MTRRTLDIIFAVGGLVLAGLDTRAGTGPAEPSQLRQGLRTQPARTAEDRIHTGERAETNENDPCLKNYAGEQLVTGKQAECYANHYIAVHLGEVNNGKTYAQTSNELRALPDQNSARRRR